VAKTSSVKRKATFRRSRSAAGRKRDSKGPYSRWRAFKSEHSATTHSQGVPALIDASSRNWLAPAYTNTEIRITCSGVKPAATPAMPNVTATGK